MILPKKTWSAQDGRRGCTRAWARLQTGSLALFVLVLSSLAHPGGVPRPSAAQASVEPSSVVVTQYTYNEDTALTSVTTQVDAQAPSTVYYTYDNFEPGSTDPTQGTVSVGNGNRVGVGPSPGPQHFNASWSYDRRDRLVGVQSQGHQSTYGYHPTQLMSQSTLDGAGTYRFYYGKGKHPRARTIFYAPSPTEAATQSSSQWKGLRFLSNEKAQLMLTARKDVQGIYDPDSGSWTPYDYDPYGAPAASTPPQHVSQAVGAPAASYALLDQSPFQYSAEYKDPAWNGYYLRGRWYDPQSLVFVQRDPKNFRNVYAYTQGNPINRIDPSGYNWKHFLKGFEEGLELLPTAFGVFGGRQAREFWKDQFQSPVNDAILLGAIVFAPAASQVLGELVGTAVGAANPEEFALGAGRRLVRSTVKGLGWTARVVGGSAAGAIPGHLHKGYTEAFGKQLGFSLAVEGTATVTKSVLEGITPARDLDGNRTWRAKVAYLQARRVGTGGLQELNRMMDLYAQELNESTTTMHLSELDRQLRGARSLLAVRERLVKGGGVLNDLATARRVQSRFEAMLVTVRAGRRLRKAVREGEELSAILNGVSHHAPIADPFDDFSLMVEAD